MWQETIMVWVFLMLMVNLNSLLLADLGVTWHLVLIQLRNGLMIDRLGQCPQWNCLKPNATLGTVNYPSVDFKFNKCLFLMIRYYTYQSFCYQHIWDVIWWLWCLKPFGCLNSFGHLLHLNFSFSMWFLRCCLSSVFLFSWNFVCHSKVY